MTEAQKLAISVAATKAEELLVALNVVSYHLNGTAPDVARQKRLILSINGAIDHVTIIRMCLDEVSKSL